MSLNAKVLVDNNGMEATPGEWGLSIYIVYNGKKILLDAGASDLFLANADAFGIDISQVEYAVLSHAHYDHSLGMKGFFNSNEKAKFYVRGENIENCYAKKFFLKKYIGVPRKITAEFPDRFEHVKGDYKLCDGVTLVPHKIAGLSEQGKRECMYVKEGHRFVPDCFAHEQSLVFNTDKGLVIFNSCSHGGAANIIKEGAMTFPDKHVYGIVGGFHLFNKSEGEIRELAHQIKNTKIEYVCTGHCTKNRAYKILQEELGDKLHQLSVGMEMEF